MTHRAEVDATRELIEELLRTGLTLVDLLDTLLDELPAEAFPDEDNGRVLLEMVIGTCRPAVAAAGESHCRRATALIGAVRDRLLADLEAAAAAAASAERPA